jgi:tetratricopeptide (TPR) repeat protein
MPETTGDPVGLIPGRSTPPADVTTASSPRPFVGRSHELRLFDRLFGAAAHGRGALAVVTGVAGVGKSQLGDEAVDRARALGLRTASERCWVEGGAPALWPWQPIMADLCGAEAAGLLAAHGGHGTVDPDRFLRFVAATEQLRRATLRQPACVVIDDIQAADTGTVLLTRFVARSVARLRLVLIVTRRTGTATTPDVDRLLDEIEREAAAVLPLRGFDLADTEAFLAAHGCGPYDADDLRAVHRLSDGSPLYLRRVAVPGGPSPAGTEPLCLRAAIDETLDRLQPDALHVLGMCTVLGHTASLPEAADVAGVEPAALREVLEAAATAGLADLAPPDRFSFAHDLVRTALEERTAGNRLLDAHAAAGALLIGPVNTPDTQVRAAHHLLHAAPRSPADTERAVAACRAAARSLVDNFAYEQADEMLTAAGRLQPAATGAFLVEWAEAALLCGRLAEARRRFDQASTVARHDRDPCLLADAALGMGGVWVAERRAPVERAQVLGRQRAALAALPAAEVGRRCRLEARLHAEAVYDGAPLAPLLEALDAARHSGDPRARAEALSLVHHCMLAPEHTRNRLALADELTTVASEAGLGVLSLMGLCWRAVNLFLAGRPDAVRALADLRERADALSSRNIIYLVEVLDVMLRIRSGRLDDAEQAAEACHQLGAAVGDIDAFAYLSAHILAIRWMQGREAELVDLADEAAGSPTLVQSEFALRATAAILAARAGRRDQAQAALEHLSAQGLAALPRSSTWLTGIVAIVETAAELGDTKVLGEAYDLLLPFADLPVMPSLAVACLGSTHRALGVAAAARGEEDLAIGHLEQAVTANRHLGNRPMTAICQAELAQALVGRGQGDDLARADDLWAVAVPAARAMGLTGRLAAWERCQASTGTVAGGAVAAARGEIRREGTGWIIGVDDHHVPVPDLVGMRYLAQLLTHPGQPIAALELAAEGPVPAEPSHQPVLDGAAQAAYLARGRQLAERLAAAEADHDREAVAALQAELDALVDHVEAASGVAGRSRTFAGPAERARTAVRKAIRRAIDHIDTAHPGLADLLRATVSTGFTCLYTEAPHHPVRWSTTRHRPTTP